MELRNLDHGFDLKAGNVGVTIRKGVKWALRPGSKFALIEQHSDEEVEDEAVGSGTVLGHWSGRFDEVPANLMKIEHNDAATDPEVCLAMMKAGYGDKFTEADLVTALIYIRTV